MTGAARRKVIVCVPWHVLLPMLLMLHIVHAAHAAAGGGGCNGGDGGGCSGGGSGGGGGGGCCSCGCCRSSAFSYSFCRSRLYPLPLKHVAASKAACFNFSLADGCFNDWSPLSPICPCAIQLTSGERPVYDSTFSSSLSSRSARKTQVRSRKKTSERKKTRLAAGKKRPAAGKSYFRSGKNASKKCRFAAGKIQSSRKNTLQQHKSTFAAEKKHFGGSGKKPSEAGKKPVRGKKKTGRSRKKTSSRESPALQPKKLPQRKKYISATGKSSSPHSQCVASSPSSTGTAQQSPSATSYRSTGNVNRVAFSDSTVIMEDLTEFSNNGASSSGLVRAIQQFEPIQFDMACADDDENRTCEPDFKEPNHFHHVRMMTLAGSNSADIILDSGADTSALPLAYIDVGESRSHETIGQDYIDAQGGTLDIRDTRLAPVGLGNGVVSRERFIIANISCPLLALGHIIRAGWELQHTNDGICLVKNDRFVNVHFKRNSLCVQGCIRMISEDVTSPKSTAPSLPAVRAIHLERVLRRLLPGWNKSNPQVRGLRINHAQSQVC